MDAVTNDAEGVDFSFSEFRHPLLQLMPYGASAPQHLKQLEQLVVSALDTGADPCTREGVWDQLMKLVAYPALRLPDATGLVIEVLREVCSRTSSPLAHERLACALLTRTGMSISLETVMNGACLPTVMRDATMLEPSLLLRELPRGHEALHVWEALVSRLAASSEAALQALGTADLNAALRAVILYSTYAQSARSLDSDADRLARFQDTGLPVWQMLLQVRRGRPEADSSLEAVFGELAQRAVWQRLFGAAEVKKLSTSTQQPDPSRPERVITTTEPSLIVVRGHIPVTGGSEDQEILKRYAALQQPMPVARLPGIGEIDRLQNCLADEFPWAREAVDALTGELKTRRFFGGVELGFAPVLLVGMPGCGKSRLARRFAEELRIPFHPLALAGMNDSMPILGTSRGWSGGQPSPLLEKMLTHQSASLLVLLDEIDKVGASAANSVPPTVALLNLLEPENAVRWHDTYLQTTCDLSKLMFVATANGLSGLSKPLLSRFRIILMPEPGQGDLAVIAKGAVRDLAKEWGLPERALEGLAAHVPLTHARTAREVRALTRRHLRSWAERHLGPPRLH